MGQVWYDQWTALPSQAPHKCSKSHRANDAKFHEQLPIRELQNDSIYYSCVSWILYGVNVKLILEGTDYKTLKNALD
jgi:hypothetical protein